MDVVWNPDEHSVEDLVVCLGQKVGIVYESFSFSLLGAEKVEPSYNMGLIRK